MLCGPFLEHSSIARINREVGTSLLESSCFDASLEPSCHSKLLSQVVSRGDRVLKGFRLHAQSLDLTIRNQWPPDSRRPSRGKLAIILSWSYSVVPREWIAQIENNVDELWVPSHFVRDGFVRYGVSAHRVQVIPMGVDPELFSPEGAVARPHGCRKFVFLFKGQPSQCQGVDTLLVAYREAFDSGDDVTLVISSSSSIPHQMNMVDGLLRAHLSDSTAPHILLLPDQFDDATLAAFYRGADVFVYSYRASGFPMTVLEAMACGKPVITSAEGPSRDFCTQETACLVAARESAVTCEPPRVGELVGNPTWFEPDVRELAQTMLDIYQNAGKFAARGRAAARAIRQSHNWSRITPLYHSRIQQLVSQLNPEEASEIRLTMR